MNKQPTMERYRKRFGAVFIRKTQLGNVTSRWCYKVPKRLGWGRMMNDLILTTAQEARGFAVASHGNQKYGEHPYVYHLDAVFYVLAPYCYLLKTSEEIRIVAYLHDVVEDTAVSLWTIEKVFGRRIADLVGLVTDEEGVNRKERKYKTNFKLSKVEEKDYIALLVKAADRLSNIRESAKDERDSNLEMYHNEHSEFHKAVYRPDLCGSLWDEMRDILMRKPL